MNPFCSVSAVRASGSGGGGDNTGSGVIVQGIFYQHTLRLLCQ